MGLDMYLCKKRNNELEEVCYWRKANEIHAWFERALARERGQSNFEIEDCEEYKVSEEMLRQLVKDCRIVLQYATDEGISEEGMATAELLMPTMPGFFFGSTDYAQYYVRDLEDTVSRVESLLPLTEDLYYYAWW